MKNDTPFVASLGFTDEVSLSEQRSCTHCTRSGPRGTFIGYFVGVEHSAMQQESDPATSSTRQVPMIKSNI